MIEQRQVGRWEIGRQVKVKLAGAYAFAPSYIKDLNFKGVQIALKIKLPEAEPFKFSLNLSGDIILEVEATAAWHKVIEDYNVYGLYFNKISDADKEKIFQFLLRDFPEQVGKKWWQKDEEGGELMQTDKAADRRVFARFPVQFPARFLDSDSNQEGNATTCDISAKGLGLVSQIKLNAYKALELWLDIPDNAAPLYARGEVIWCQPWGSHEYRCGVNLEKADLMGLARALRVKKP